jgi:chromosome partitioning protein
MEVVALVCQKGGVGKTTVATNLAVIAEASGIATTLLDLDPQATAVSWGDKRGKLPQVLPAQASRLERLLNDARGRGAGLVVIDTAPIADNAALEAAKAANLVLVPCQPSDFDVRTVGATVRLCEQVAGKETWVVMNAIPPQSKITEEAVEALTAGGVRVCPVKLVRRLDFVNGLPEGMAAFEWNSKGKASKEAETLWEWVRTKVNPAD